jgi:hypothetical protein
MLISCDTSLPPLVASPFIPHVLPLIYNVSIMKASQRAKFTPAWLYLFPAPFVAPLEQDFYTRVKGCELSRIQLLSVAYQEVKR